VRGILEDKKAITSNVERILSILLPVLTTKKTVEITAKITGANKNEVYKLALAMQKCK
jgi:16S rRNA C1402 (ribose-2'-O) methylase RsmI